MLQFLLLGGDEGTNCLQESMEKDTVVMAFCHERGGTNWVCNVAVWEIMGHRIWSFCIISITRVTAVHLNRLIYSWQCFNYRSGTIIIIAFICFWIAQLVFRIQSPVQSQHLELFVKRAVSSRQNRERCTRTAWCLARQFRVGCWHHGSERLCWGGWLFSRMSLLDETEIQIIS